MNILTRIMTALLSLNPAGILEDIQEVAETQATLIALEHCCNAVRDEDQYELVRQHLTEWLEDNVVDDVTAVQILSAIADIAKDCRL